MGAIGCLLVLGVLFAGFKLVDTHRDNTITQAIPLQEKAGDTLILNIREFHTIKAQIIYTQFSYSTLGEKHSLTQQLLCQSNEGPKREPERINCTDDTLIIQKLQETDTGYYTVDVYTKANQSETVGEVTSDGWNQKHVYYFNLKVYPAPIVICQLSCHPYSNWKNVVNASCHANYNITSAMFCGTPTTPSPKGFLLFYLPKNTQIRDHLYLQLKSADGKYKITYETKYSWTDDNCTWEHEIYSNEYFSSSSDYSERDPRDTWLVVLGVTNVLLLIGYIGLMIWVCREHRNIFAGDNGEPPLMYRGNPEFPVVNHA
ncbi:E3 CR1-beta [Squirrel monkey adenovirus]|nr:E3 CR1-beta [Squirrel monkey adenovirus]